MKISYNCFAGLLLVAVTLAGCGKEHLSHEKLHIPPNSFVGVGKQPNLSSDWSDRSKPVDVFLFTFDPLEKHVVWRLDPKRLRYPLTYHFRGCLKNFSIFKDCARYSLSIQSIIRPSHFHNIGYIDCDFASGTSNILCSADDVGGGDDYSAYYISIDLKNQKEYLSPLLRDYGDRGGMTEVSSPGKLVVNEIDDLPGKDTGSGHYLYLFRLPDMKRLYSMTFGKNEDVDTFGVSQSGRYVLLRVVKQMRDDIDYHSSVIAYSRESKKKGEASIIIHDKTGKPVKKISEDACKSLFFWMYYKTSFVILDTTERSIRDIEIPLERPSPCGFIDDRYILFTENNMGILFDTTNKNKSRTIFKLPESGGNSYCQFIGRWNTAVYYNNNEHYFFIKYYDKKGSIETGYIYDAKKNIYFKLGIEVDRKDHPNYIELINMSADSKFLLFRKREWTSLDKYREVYKEEYYIWHSGHLRNVTKEYKRLFSD